MNIIQLTILNGTKLESFGPFPGKAVFCNIFHYLLFIFVFKESYEGSIDFISQYWYIFSLMLKSMFYCLNLYSKISFINLFVGRVQKKLFNFQQPLLGVLKKGYRRESLIIKWTNLFWKLSEMFFCLDQYFHQPKP